MKLNRRFTFKSLVVMAVILAVGLLARGGVNAAPPPTQLSYQGLIKVSGVPFTGTGTFKFAIVNVATGDGTTLWATGDETLTVTNGLFNFMLGSTVPLPSSVFDNDPIYLQVWFNGTALEPNQRIVSAAYALRAAHALEAEHAGEADHAANLGGSPASDYLKATSALDASNLASGTVPLARLPGIPWAQLTSVPSSFADGVDNDTTYSAGTNLTLSGTTFSLASPLSSNLNMGNNKVTSLGAPTASGDAANKQYVDDARAALEADVAALDGDVTALDASKLNLSGGTVTGMLTVAAPIVAGDYVKIGASTAACDSGKIGSVRWNSTTSSLELCDGTAWQQLQVAQKPIVMYAPDYGAATNPVPAPAIGGRSGADARCAAASTKPAGYSRFRGFLSVSASDSILLMPDNFGVPTTVPVISSVRKLIANNWYELLDGSINQSLNSAQVFTSPYPTVWWTGSFVSGAIYTGNNCSGWTSSSGAGVTGDSNSTTTGWLQNTFTGCGSTAVLVCIAY